MWAGEVDESDNKANYNTPRPYAGFLGGLDGKESACNIGDPGLIPGSGRSLREGHGYPLQYSCLENSMDRGYIWQDIVYGGHKESDTTGQLTHTRTDHVQMARRKSFETWRN